MKRKLIVMCPTTLLLGAVLILIGWRVPMLVTELKVFPECRGQPAYYVCPRCGLSMEREFMSFCDCCGQWLDWRTYQNVKIICFCPYSKPNAMAAKT